MPNADMKKNLEKNVVIIGCGMIQFHFSFLLGFIDLLATSVTKKMLPVVPND